MKKFKKSGFLKNKSINIISKFFLSSFIVISFFYIAPIIINFADKNFNNKEYTNNSKNILNKVLNKDQLVEEESIVENNELDLLWDIIEENKSEIDLVTRHMGEIEDTLRRGYGTVDDFGWRKWFENMIGTPTGPVLQANIDRLADSGVGVIVARQPGEGDFK